MTVEEMTTLSKDNAEGLSFCNASDPTISDKFSSGVLPNQ